jgi:acetyl/propionyl-CoA carboxylase alpha subunit
VHADCDRLAPHVRYADEAVALGADEAVESYLRIDKLIDAARRTGADAVHPGYGFLAENADFAQAAVDAGLCVVGPRPEVIALMGGKTAAREAAARAGVPIVPGSGGPLPADASDDDLRRSGEQIGYPLFVKAVAGGGGKGMRLVRPGADLVNAVRGAASEATAAFGSGEVYLERAIERGRHIEVQLLADAHGTVVPFVERECSIQRRHQKLIEETPSVAVDDATRRALAAAAAALAREVGYTNAGTIEFLLDRDGKFYFLEMNTRLQVEHPVTEFVTGVDIVKEQLTIAAGRRMRYRPEDIRPKGWSIECRLTAEDPFNNFMPNSGVVTYLKEPTGPGVRVESALYRGYEVSLFYDPMVAKLIVWGENRAEAILRMRRALNEYRISGIKTSIPFHQEIMDSTEFIWGTFDTGFLDRRRLVAKNEPDQEQARIAAVAAALVAHEAGRRAVNIGGNEESSAASLWKLAGREGGMGGRW